MPSRWWWAARTTPTSRPASSERFSAAWRWVRPLPVVISPFSRWYNSGSLGQEGRHPRLFVPAHRPSHASPAVHKRQQQRGDGTDLLYSRHLELPPLQQYIVSPWISINLAKKGYFIDSNLIQQFFTLSTSRVYQRKSDHELQQIYAFALSAFSTKGISRGNPTILHRFLIWDDSLQSGSFAVVLHVPSVQRREDPHPALWRHQ